jgi:hypothetical protein
VIQFEQSSLKPCQAAVTPHVTLHYEYSGSRRSLNGKRYRIMYRRDKVFVSSIESLP